MEIRKSAASLSFFPLSLPMDVSNNTGWKRRKNSQKPNDELYSTFKQTFTELGPNVSAALPAEDPGVTLDDHLAIPITLAG